MAQNIASYLGTVLDMENQIVHRFFNDLSLEFTLNKEETLENGRQLVKLTRVVVDEDRKSQENFRTFFNTLNIKTKEKGCILAVQNVAKKKIHCIDHRRVYVGKMEKSDEPAPLYLYMQKLVKEGKWRVTEDNDIDCSYTWTKSNY